MEILFSSAGGGKLKMGRADNVPLLTIRDQETGAKATPAVREAAQSVLKAKLVAAKVRSLVFDRMVIGPSIHEPLPGTEWPPSS